MRNQRKTYASAMAPDLRRIGALRIESRVAPRGSLWRLVGGAALIAASVYWGLANAQLPAAQSADGVEYVTGGFGSDESTAFKAAESSYPLALTFAATDEGGGSRPYIAEVALVVKDQSGAVVMDVPSAGPYFLARLQPGSYTIEATYQGMTQTRTLEVKEGGSTRDVLTWKRP